MSLDPKVLRTVLNSREFKKRQKELEYFKRRKSIYSEIPRIAQIDAQLKATITHLARAAFDEPENSEYKIGLIRDNYQKIREERGQLLSEAGYPADYLSEQYDCEECSDTGYIGTQPCKCLIRECSAQQAKELSYFFNPTEFDFCAYNALFYSEQTDSRYGVSPRENMEYVYDKCVDFAENFGRFHENLLLTGSTGLGKTFLSGCIAKVIAAQGFSVVYDTAIHIITCMEQEKFGGLNEEGRLQLKRVFSGDLLIIDDLGTELQTNFTISAVYSLLNERITRSLPMIVNTNIKKDDIAVRYNAQIASRLSGNFTVLNFFGEDIRLLKNKDNI